MSYSTMNRIDLRRTIYEQVKGTTEVTGFRRSLESYTRITNSTVISLILHNRSN